MATNQAQRVLNWEDGAEISLRLAGGEVVVVANAAGLPTLAEHLLTLAQDGTHLRLEAANGLTEDSASLTLERASELRSDFCQIRDTPGGRGPRTHSHAAL